MALKNILIYTFALILVGCGGGGGNSDSTEEDLTDVSEVADTLQINDTLESKLFDSSEVSEENPATLFTVSDRYAVYYSEEDAIEGAEGAGKGTNGSDPSIERTYIDEGPVESYRLNYAWDDFKDIESEKLNVKWTGTLDLLSETGTVYAIIDSSYSSVNFSLEDELMHSYSHCSPCIVSLELEQGSYDFEVDYHNHWHTTEVSLVFSTQVPRLADLAGADISIPDGDILVAVAARTSDRVDQEITVDIPEGEDSISIIASSYDPVNWVFEGATDRLSKVYYYSYSVNSEVAGAESESLGYQAYFDAEDMLSTVRNLVGRTPEYSFYEYSTDYFLLALDSGSSTLHTEEVVLVDNLQGIALSTATAVSAVGEQEVATRFEITESVKLSAIGWTGWSQDEVEVNSSFITYLSRDFNISIYSGINFPLIKEVDELVNAKARYFYPTQSGNVFQLTADFSDEHILQPGTYWISINHSKAYYQNRFDVVTEEDESPQGAVYRPASSTFWYPVNEENPVTSKGVSLVLSGYK